MCVVWSCDAVDYVDPRWFRREDAEGCEQPTENQLTPIQEDVGHAQLQLQSDFDSNVSPQTVSI